MRLQKLFDGFHSQWPRLDGWIFRPRQDVTQEGPHHLADLLPAPGPVPYSEGPRRFPLAPSRPKSLAPYRECRGWNPSQNGSKARAAALSIGATWKEAAGGAVRISEAMEPLVLFFWFWAGNVGRQGLSQAGKGHSEAVEVNVGASR